MKTISLILILFTFGFSEIDSIATQIQLKTYLEEKVVPLNREVVFVVELSWVGDLTRYGIVDAGDPVTTNLELRSSGTSNRAYTDASGMPRAIKTIDYYFTPKEMGMAYVDGVVIKYEDRLTKKQESLLAKRLEAKIVEPLPEPGNSTPLPLVIVEVIAVIFILSVIYFVFKYFRQRKLEQAANDEPKATLEEIYLAQIKNDLKDNQKSPQEKTDLLAKQFNSYFYQKCGWSPGAGWDELIEFLAKEGIGENLQQKVRQYGEWVDRSRFAMENPSDSDLHLFVDTLELILNKMNI